MFKTIIEVMATLSVIYSLNASEPNPRDPLAPEYKVELALQMVKAAQPHGIDPRILAGISWRESRLRPYRIGDQGRSCGITQIRHDIRDRPSCEQVTNTGFALKWTANELARLRTQCDSEWFIAAYNGGCSGFRVRGAGTGYQNRVLRAAGISHREFRNATVTIR